MSHKRNIALTFAALLPLALGLAGCATDGRTAVSGSTAPPANDIALANGFPPDQANEARKLYLLKCAKCHRFYDPAAYPDAEWSEWMRKMSRKARLDAGQERLLAGYLQAFRQRPPK